MAGRLKVCGIAAAPVVAVVHFQPEARPVVAAVPALHQGRHSGTLSHRRVILDRLLKGQPRYRSSFLHLSIIVVCLEQGKHGRRLIYYLSRMIKSVTNYHESRYNRNNDPQSSLFCSLVPVLLVPDWTWEIPPFFITGVELEKTFSNSLEKKKSNNLNRNITLGSTHQSINQSSEWVDLTENNTICESLLASTALILPAHPTPIFSWFVTFRNRT